MKKRIVTLFIALFVAMTNMSYAQILTENFDYPAGDLLTAHGWTAHSGAGAFSVAVGTPGLTFQNYLITGGNTAVLAPGASSAEDVHVAFTAVSSGSVYASFLVKFNLKPAVGYFFHLGPNPISTTFRGRVWARPTATDSTKFNFGLGFSSTDTVFSGSEYNVGSTYLVVLKYEIVDGTNNDKVSLFVFDETQSLLVEPSVPTVGPLTVATQTDINPGAIALRQFNLAQNLLVDNIQVSTSWMLSVVPVEFITFSATSNNGQVDLAWSTASETNNRGFEIERSSDNVNFSSIGFVAGKGTTTGPSNYLFTDKVDASGTLYYRLKQVDFDGTFAYSNTVEVNNSVVTGFDLLQNYPNPFNPSTTIGFSVAESGIATLKVYNVTGEVVAELFNSNVEKGTMQTVSFDASNLTSGVYFARLTQGNNVKNIKLILNK